MIDYRIKLCNSSTMSYIQPTHAIMSTAREVSAELTHFVHADHKCQKGVNNEWVVDFELDSHSFNDAERFGSVGLRQLPAQKLPLICYCMSHYAIKKQQIYNDSTMKQS